MESRLLKGGRVTLPAAVRRHLGVLPGDVVELVLEGTTLTLRRPSGGAKKAANARPGEPADRAPDASQNPQGSGGRGAG